jgi:DNA-binding LacI/PurR family transcriptional regulator
MLNRSASAPSDPKPTAVVCSDARVARAAIDEFAHARIAVPDEVSVVAIDAASACQDDLPVITSASSDPQKMGIAAAQQLLDFPFAAGGHFRRIVPPAYLSVGKTSGPALTTTAHGGLKHVA